MRQWLDRGQLNHCLDTVAASYQTAESSRTRVPDALAPSCVAAESSGSAPPTRPTAGRVMLADGPVVAPGALTGSCLTRPAVVSGLVGRL
jgi:hypothetical protein